MAHPNGSTADSERIRVGQTVRALRKARALTIPELADKAGMSRTFLNQIELGLKDLPPARAVQIANVLHVRPIAILNPDHFTEELVASAGEAS
ncbi:helix-turn-helix domain-containing protein [Enterococcus hirae]|uniref:helix-turn-helix domain-containing protein n=1 Tax=Enterococcus hirae TaxID=1354 RepID=UPI0013688A14|nr:helix-turn-helix transcriptional regulator [Enterococcus hirae]NAE18231.1 helix-turn-helix domain-containing protein [Enterococcus hirae]